MNGGKLHRMPLVIRDTEPHSNISAKPHIKTSVTGI